MDDMSNLRAAIEGIKEGIQNIDENDIFLNYGRIIAQKHVNFSEELLNNKTELTKLIMKYKKGKSQNIDW